VKKLLPLALLLAATLPALAANEGDAKPARVTGWIVDEWCRSANAHPGGKGCALDCHGKGAALVLYEPESKKVYRLDDQKAAAEHVGYATVTGKLDGNKITVAAIEPAPEGKAGK
jgi:hypothetical protein